MMNWTSARIGRLSSLILLAVLVTGQALAMTFDFTGSSSENDLGLATGNLGDSLTLAEGNLTVRAFDDLGERGEIHRGSNGLGVYGDPNNNAVGEPESLRFRFSGSAVSVSSLIFERGADNGRLDLFVDGEFAETIQWMTGGGTLVEHALGDAPGNVFELRGDRRSFRVSQLTAAVSAIPEPSAAFLFGAGALVVSRAARRR